MARQLKPYTERLKATLQEHGLYCEKNDPLILDVAMMEVIRDNYYDSIKQNPPLLSQIGSQGQTKVTINPVYIELRKALATIITGKARLGLGNTTKVEEDTTSAMESFLKEITE